MNNPLNLPCMECGRDPHEPWCNSIASKRAEDTTIIIPCRAGSTRVKDKNFRPFADSSLLDIKVNQAKKLGLKVVINSDSPLAKHVALVHGVEFEERPEYYASSKCTNSEYYSYMASTVSTPNMMVLQPTAPLLKIETIRECYRRFIRCCVRYNEANSLVTADYVKKFAFFRDKPINYELDNMPNSQDLEPIIMPTYNVMIAKTGAVTAARNMITSRCIFHQIPSEESMEIDTQLDFDIAEFLYVRSNS